MESLESRLQETLAFYQSYSDTSRGNPGKAAINIIGLCKDTLSLITKKEAELKAKDKLICNLENELKEKYEQIAKLECDRRIYTGTVEHYLPPNKNI